MKRFFTLVAGALSMALSTLAGETSPAELRPMYVAAPEELTKTYVTEAEGTMERYAASGLIDTSWGLMDFAGVKNDQIGRAHV